MKKCKDCGKEVSNSAKKCPNCGKKLKKPIVLYIILGIILLCIVGGIIASNTEEKRQKVFNQDETASYLDVYYTIKNVERTNGEKYFEASEGKEYIVFTLQIENKSDSKIPYNDWDWKLVDGTGDENSSAIWGNDKDTTLNSGDLNPNGIKNGTIAFEIPKGDKNLILRYYDTIMDEERSFEFKITD